MDRFLKLVCGLFVVAFASASVAAVLGYIETQGGAKHDHAAHKH